MLLRDSRILPALSYAMTRTTHSPCEDISETGKFAIKPLSTLFPLFSASFL